MNEAIAAVRDARDRSLDPVFCATGGFKAEIAFLNLLGALLAVEVFYIYEQFREVVRLPRLPLAWDADWVLQRRRFFEWIDDEPRSSAEVASRLKADPALQPLIEDAADGCSYLNAAGELLYRAAGAVGPRAVWPHAAPLPPGDKNGLSRVSHHRPTGWKAFVERLCKVDCVSRVSFDGAASGGTAVKVLCASTGAIGVRWGPADCELPLRVETTAVATLKRSWSETTSRTRSCEGEVAGYTLIEESFTRELRSGPADYDRRTRSGVAVEARPSSTS